MSKRRYDKEDDEPSSAFVKCRECLIASSLMMQSDAYLSEEPKIDFGIDTQVSLPFGSILTCFIVKWCFAFAEKGPTYSPLITPHTTHIPHSFIACMSRTHFWIEVHHLKSYVTGHSLNTLMSWGRSNFKQGSFLHQ